MTDIDESASDFPESEDILSPTAKNRARTEPLAALKRPPAPRKSRPRAPGSSPVVEVHEETRSESEDPQDRVPSRIGVTFEANEWYLAHSTAIAAAIRSNDPLKTFPSLSKHDIAAWSQRLRRMHTGPQLGRVILPEPANGKKLTEDELEEAVYAFMETLTKEDLLTLHEETDFLLTALRWHFTLPDRENPKVPYPQVTSRRFNIPHYNIGINIMPREHADRTLFFWRLTLLGSWVQELENKSTWFVWSNGVEEGWDVLIPAGMPQFGEQDLEAGPSMERRGINDMPFGYPRTGRESFEYVTGHAVEGGPLEMRWDF